jgi:hypothetical protein
MTPARVRLSAMMFLEFFIWGAWLPLIFGYLPSLGSLAPAAGLDPEARSRSARSRRCSSARSSPTATSRRRSSSPSATRIGGRGDPRARVDASFWPFFVLMLVHCLFYVPTISITNTIAFTHLKDAQKEFGRVRCGARSGGSRRAGRSCSCWSTGPRCRRSARSASSTWLKGARHEQGGRGDAGRDALHLHGGGHRSLLARRAQHRRCRTRRREGARGGETFAGSRRCVCWRSPSCWCSFVVTFFDARVHQCYFIWTGAS